MEHRGIRDDWSHRIPVFRYATYELLATRWMEQRGIRGDRATYAPYSAALHTGYSLTMSLFGIEDRDEDERVATDPYLGLLEIAMRTFALSSCIGLLVACVTATTPKPFNSTWPGSIYFVARETRTGVEALYRITSGTDPQMVYQPRAHDSNFATSVDQMVCSPDGKKIAMQQTDSGGIPHLGAQFGKSRLIILDLVSLTEREVSDPKMLNLGAPTWSPDGSQLLATSSHSRPPPSYGSPYWYLVDTKTLQVTPFVDGDGKEIAGHDPSWSPDGKWIFSFGTSFPPGKGSFVNAQTGAKRRDSIPDVGGDPRWSPTGKLIAYFWTGRQDRLQSGRTPWQIRTTEVSTLKTRTLTSGAIDSQPNWSPDEKWILFSRRESLDNSNGLFVVETGNSTAYKLMVNFDEPVAPTWCR